MNPTKEINPRVAFANAQSLAGTVGGAQTNEGIVGGDYGNVINSKVLGSAESPITLPDTQAGTTSSRITGKTVGLLELDALAQKTEKEANDKQAELKASEGKQQNLLERIGLVKSSKTELEEDAGVNQLKDTSRKAANDLLVSQRAQTNELRALQGAPLTDVQRAAKTREIDRKYAYEQADLQLTYHLANSDLNAAQTVINDKIELALEPLYEELDLQKNIYNQISGSLSKAEDREWQAALSRTENTIKETQALEKYKGDIAITASQNGTPLPSYVQSQINRATTQAEVNQVLADNGISLAVPKVGVSGTIPSITLEQSNDPFIQSLLATAGGKALTDTSIQKLDKGLTVLGQLGVLQTNIQGVKTGPIVGAFKGANPWDTNAQVIKKQLNAIVPNLARGVYGEVGVLTDNDIKTYSGTIPNLTSTEAIRSAVLYITLDMIGKSIKNTLSVNAAAGRDVSGFVEIYTEMENAKNQILSTIPGNQVPASGQGGQPTEEDLYNEYLKTTGQAPQATTTPARTSLFQGDLNKPNIQPVNLMSLLKQ